MVKTGYSHNQSSFACNIVIQEQYDERTYLKHMMYGTSKHNICLASVNKICLEITVCGMDDFGYFLLETAI